MFILIKALLLISLLIIFLQDQKNRQVYIFLFPLFGVLGSSLFFFQSNLEDYLLSICVNTSIVLIIILINYLYAKFVMKKNLLKEAMGLGDLFFFFAFALCFPTVSFINFFVSSILFTFILDLALSKLLKTKNKSIPLAGNMSLFLIAIYTISWFLPYDSIYTL